MRPGFKARRQAERRECSIKAQAHRYDGAPPIDCIVTDFSPTGAKIVFPTGQEPPSAFDLFVPSRGDTRHALVRWKTPESIGVEFIQGRGSTEDQRLSEMLVRIAKIEEEFRAFRADVALARAGAMAQHEAPRTDALQVAAPVVSPDVDGILSRLALIEERGEQDRTEWEVLADRLVALETPTEMSAPMPVQDNALAARVAKLESRNDDILNALKTTLAMLGELKDATAPMDKDSMSLSQGSAPFVGHARAS